MTLKLYHDVKYAGDMGGGLGFEVIRSEAAIADRDDIRSYIAR